MAKKTTRNFVKNNKRKSEASDDSDVEITTATFSQTAAKKQKEEPKVQSTTRVTIEHSHKHIVPKAFDMIFDFDALKFTFAEPVRVVYKQSHHSGFQPQKEFQRREGGSFTKKMSLDLILKSVDNQEAKEQLAELMKTIRNAFVSMYQEYSGRIMNIHCPEVTYTTKNEEEVLSIPVTASRVQIAHCPTNFDGPKFLPDDEIRNKLAEMLDIGKDQHICGSLQVKENLVIGYTSDLHAYLIGMKEHMENGGKQTVEWPYFYFPDKLITVSCSVVGGKIYSNREQMSCMRPSLFIDLIRVHTDKLENGENAKWCLRFLDRQRYNAILSETDELM